MKKNETIQLRNVPSYSGVRIFGYSLGASIGSYVAMMLDGGLNLSLPTSLYQSIDNDGDDDDDDDKLDEGITTSNTNNTDTTKDVIQRMIGMYEKKVKCICISPLPCISRTITPQYIFSGIPSYLPMLSTYLYLSE